MKVFIENMGEIEFKSLHTKKWENEKSLEEVSKIDANKLRKTINNKYIEEVLNIKDKEIYTIYECNPKILLNPFRFDLFVKYNYVKAYIENNDLKEAKEIYLDHIKAFNNFKEPDKSKNTKEDYIKSFNKLIDEATKSDFEVFFIPVSKSGQIIDGSHRVAISLYLNKKIKISLFDILDADYSYKFFEKRDMKQVFIYKIANDMPKIDRSLRKIVSKEKIEDRIIEKEDIYYEKKSGDLYEYIISSYEV